MKAGISSIRKKYFSPVENCEQITRCNNFNVVRFVAAIMVIYGHMSAAMGVPAYCIYGQAVSSIGVKVFFIISGYLITKSFLSDSNFGRYMLRRCFRIFPGLIAVVLFSAFIVGPVVTSVPLKDYFTNSYTWAYLKNIILYPIYSLPGVFGNYTYPNTVNASLWTLPVEFALYLILPLFIVIFKKLKILKWGILIVFVISIVAAVIYTAYFPTARFVVYGTNLPSALALIPFFFMGSLLSLPELKKIFNLQLATALLVAGSLVNLSYAKAEFVLSLILPYFILSFSLAPKPFFGNWFSKCDFSYGLYLYGFVVQQLFWHQLQKLQNGFFSLNVVTCICFAGTLCLAVVSWYLVEKPTQKLGKRLINKLLEREKRKA